MKHIPSQGLNVVNSLDPQVIARDLPDSISSPKEQINQQYKELREEIKNLENQEIKTIFVDFLLKGKVIKGIKDPFLLEKKNRTVGNIYLWISASNKNVVSIGYINFQGHFFCTRLNSKNSPVILDWLKSEGSEKRSSFYQQMLIKQDEEFGVAFLNTFDGSEKAKKLAQDLAQLHKNFPGLKLCELWELWEKEKFVDSHQEAKKALSSPDIQPYDYRIWFSTANTLLYAVKLPSGLIDFNQIDLNKPSLTQSSISYLIKLNSLVKESNEHLKIVEKEESSSAKKSYDRQLIFNLGTGNSAKGITGKAKKANLPCKMIDLRMNQTQLNDEQKKMITDLTHHSRIYIIGHCDRGKSTINSNEQVKVHADEFAQMIAMHAPHLKNSSDSQKLTISLVACYSGQDNEAEPSFAFRLCEELYKLGIKADVIGRTGRTSAWNGEEEGYFKLVDARYQQLGDKLKFSIDSSDSSQSTIHVEVPKNSKQSQREKTQFDPGFIEFKADHSLNLLNSGLVSREKLQAFF